MYLFFSFLHSPFYLLPSDSNKHILYEFPQDKCVCHSKIQDIQEILNSKTKRFEILTKYSKFSETQKNTKMLFCLLVFRYLNFKIYNIYINQMKCL